MKLMKYPFKKWRSLALTNLYQDMKMVCFTSGNAGKWLRRYGADVLCIGTHEDLVPNKWFSVSEIRQMFPDRIDVTSGHLSISDMKLIGMLYKAMLGDLPDEVLYVPSGSGETLVSLKLAYPENDFVAVYNLDEHTEFSEDAPLNDLVELLAFDIIKEDKK